MRSRGNYAVPVPGGAPIKRVFDQINADFPDLVPAFNFHAQPAALRSQIAEAIARIDSKSQEIELVCLGQSRKQVGSASEAPVGNKVFLGHGRSPIWRELKDFIADRLQLPWDEYNREPAAGLFTPERVRVMLDQACFTFLVMTAEDQQADGTLRTRENVVHEAGLFQGRLGFRRAIILLEDGCAAFSYIHGLTVISFPKGHIIAAFEEVRRTLEREGILVSN
jgi:predicted nucleotide-binding protein